MRKVLTIRIPEPCHENWNIMTPKDKGRHCALCQKPVIDFTKFTDEQIVKTYMQEVNLCGRFKNTQLERELVFSRKDKNNYLSLVASSLFAFLAIGTQGVKAQGEPRINQTDSTLTPLIKDLKARSILQEKAIKGTIINDGDGLPLPGANVIVKGTLRHAQADFDGNYSIKAKIGETLVFSFSGMHTAKMIIDTNSVINIVLKVNFASLEQIIIGVTSCSTIEDKNTKIEKKLKRKEKHQQVKNGNIKRSSVGKFLYNITNIFRSK